MCDAIAAVCYKGRLYVGIFEQKTKNKNDYWRQLANGKLFAAWLLNVYRTQGYPVDECTMFGVLAWAPRQIPDKGISHRRAHKPQRNVGEFDWYFEFRNEPRISFMGMIKGIERGR